MTRRLALETLRRVETGARALEALEHLARGRGVEPRDMDLAREIGLGALRHRGALDALAAARSKRALDSLDPVVRNALRVGLYQIVHLDRVPRHAAVHTSVELVRAARRP